jgi:hypothetical protein
MIKNKVAPLTSDYEIWHIEEDKDILLIADEEFRWSKKKRILQEYLKTINNNISISVLEKERKDKLKFFYSNCLQKAKKLRFQNNDINNNEPQHKMPLNKKYFQTDAEGNLYVSDNI